MTEVKGSHAIYVSQPAAVATLIEQAAKSVRCNRRVSPAARHLDSAMLSHC